MAKAGRPSKGPWWNKTIKQWCFWDGKKQVRCGPKRAEAVQFHHRYMAEKGEHPEGVRDMTLGMLIDRWYIAAFSALTERTRDSYRSYAESLRKSCGGTLLRNLKASHVTRWVNANEGWKSQGTKHLAISIARIIGAFAQSDEYLDRNPFQYAKRPAMPRRKASTREEATQIIRPETAGAVADFLMVAMETGCRPGELRTLETGKINWKARTAEVLGKKTIANPEGWRTVHLSSKAIEILKRWAKDFPVGAVLRNTRGKPWSAKAIQGQYNRLSKKAGVKVVPHQTRGIFATEAIREGIDSLHVSKLLGHASVTVVGKHYADIQDQDLAKVMRDREQPKAKASPRKKGIRKQPRRR